jgi:thiol-disulfide isomerase/thioredoxin
MTLRQQWMIIGGIVALLAVVLGTASVVLRDEMYPIDVGAQAPAFTAKSLSDSGRAKTLDDYRGKVVFLNVWATWCLPCREEMPSMERLQRAFPNSDLRIVAINTQDPVPDATIMEFARELGVTFEILRDSSERIMSSYRTTGFPESFIIDRRGTIRQKWIGPKAWDDDGSRAFIAQLLAEPAAPPAR